MWNGTLYILLLVLMKKTAAQIPDVIQFFPDLDDDASKVTWGHRINSRNGLTTAINDPNIMMLEADVLEGKLTTNENSSQLLPIMGHPPEKISDLSLNDWVLQIIEANEGGNKKGAKLDVKEIEILEESLMILKNYSSVINFPLWLNADILAGPGGQGKTPIDQRSFLTLCRTHFPQATLSVGWTTGYNSQIDYRYTTSMVQQMSNSILVHNIRQPITFPIRAALIKGSVRNLIKLMDLVPNSSFTIWSAITDRVDMNAVADLIHMAGRKRVYIDIPAQQMRALKSVLGEEDSLPSIAPHFQHFGFIISALFTLLLH